MCPATAPRPSADFQSAASIDDWTTFIIELAHRVDPRTNAIGTPRSESVTSAVDIHDDDVSLPEGGINYGAYNNPSWTVWERVMAGLEDGCDALNVPRGRDAIKLAMELLVIDNDPDAPFFVPPHLIVASNDLYPGTRRLFDSLRKWGVQVKYLSSSDPATIEAAVQDNTKVIFCEPLTNPHQDITNVKAVIDIANRHGIYSIVDSTTTPPMMFQPLKLGATVVVASALKYISGQNNTSGGYLAINKNRRDLADKLRTLRDQGFGGVMAPEISARLVEQVRNMPSRFAEHDRNAKVVVEYLSHQPGVKKIYYPGYGDDASNELARQQFGEFTGGLVSIEFEKGFDVSTFLKAFKGSNLIETADSFGADLTLMNWFPKQSGWVKAMSSEEQLANRYSPEFIRIAVGRGSASAILKHLDRAFAAVRESAARLTPANDIPRRAIFAAAL